MKVGFQRRKDRSDEKAVIPRAARVITTCHHTKQDIQRHMGVPGEKIDVVYMGVDGHLFRPATPDERRATRSEFGWSSDRVLMAFVGALGDRRKGFDTLFTTWERLCSDAAWDADLVVVGRGMELPRWKALAAERGLANRIHFMGFVKNLPGLLAACDAHVLPSRYEGYSLSTQEALSCGIPAFITQTAGIAERYPEPLQELLIKDPNNATALVEQIRNWRNRMGDFQQTIQPLSQTIRMHSWNDMAKQMFDIICSVSDK
jgi:glycosyltransferase involved in cell wall biosynthesis